MIINDYNLLSFSIKNLKNKIKNKPKKLKKKK